MSWTFIGLNDKINQNILYKHSGIAGYDRMTLLLRLARTETILNTQISHWMIVTLCSVTVPVHALPHTTPPPPIVYNCCEYQHYLQYLHPDILSPVPQPQHGNYEDLHTVARAQASVTLATTIWCFMITVPQQSTASCSNSNSSNTVWGGNTVTTTWLGRYVRYCEVLWGMPRLWSLGPGRAGCNYSSRQPEEESQPPVSSAEHTTSHYPGPCPGRLSCHR